MAFDIHVIDTFIKQLSITIHRKSLLLSLCHLLLAIIKNRQSLGNSHVHYSCKNLQILLLILNPDLYSTITLCSIAVF